MRPSPLFPLLLPLLTLLPSIASAPIPDDTITAFNNGIRCRTAPTHSAPPVRMYNHGDEIALSCQTNNGWWMTGDGCYVDSQAFHPKGSGGGAGKGSWAHGGNGGVVARRICAA